MGRKPAYRMAKFYLRTGMRRSPRYRGQARGERAQPSHRGGARACRRLTSDARSAAGHWNTSGHGCAARSIKPPFAWAIATAGAARCLKAPAAPFADISKAKRPGSPPSQSTGTRPRHQSAQRNRASPPQTVMPLKYPDAFAPIKLYINILTYLREKINKKVRWNAHFSLIKGY